MMHHIKSQLPILLWVAALATSLCSQGTLPAWRSWYNTPCFPHITATGEVAEFKASGTKLTWTCYFDGQPTALELTLPFDVPADITNGQSDHHFLVSGFDKSSGQGKIVHLRVDSSPYSLTSLQTVVLGNGIDPARIGWNEFDSQFYALDSIQDAILAAHWPSEAAMPQSFGLVVSPSTSQLLDSPLRDYGMATNRWGPGLYLHAFGSGTKIKIESSSSGWGVSTVAIEGVAPSYTLQSPSNVGASWPIVLKGPVGPFAIEDLTVGGTVASGIVPSANAWFSFNPSSAPFFPPGHTYQIVGPNGSSQPFKAIWRWGARSTEGNFKVGLPLIMYGEQKVGSQQFGVGIRFREESPPVAYWHQASVYLWVAIRSPDSPAPVIGITGTSQYLLIPDGSLGPEVISLSDTEPGHSVPFLLPIPSPSLPRSR